jgi:hypothetical protein
MLTREAMRGQWRRRAFVPAITYANVPRPPVPRVGNNRPMEMGKGTVFFILFLLFSLLLYGQSPRSSIWGLYNEPPR